MSQFGCSVTVTVILNICCKTRTKMLHSFNVALSDTVHATLPFTARPVPLHMYSSLQTATCPVLPKFRQFTKYSQGDRIDSGCAMLPMWVGSQVYVRCCYSAEAAGFLSAVAWIDVCVSWVHSTLAQP